MGGDIKYTCSNGSWSKSGGRCAQPCNETTPVYDINNNKVADKMYGITFAIQNRSDSMHTYNVCYINSNPSTLYTLNPNGTGLGIVKVNDHINCSYDENNLKEHYTVLGIRSLTCRQNDNVNNGNPYWQNTTRSCDLNEIKDSYSDIVNKQLAYGCSTCLKDINTIMTTGSKQVRMYSAGTWSVLYTTFKQNPNEGTEVSRNIDIHCNDNGTWSINSSGYVNYNSIGGSQTFTPSKYGITNGKQLTLEVWGAQGGGSKGGKGGYSKGQYKYTSGSITVWVGGQGSRTAGGWNGGGNGGGDSNDGNNGGDCGGDKGYGGGGKTNIDINNVEVIIAGGGGGQSGAGSSGGNGGGESGSDGGGKLKGYGGSQTAAGGSSDECVNGGKGSYLQGGKGCSGGSHKWCGGGGGGGYYGGGGGDYDGDSDKSGGGGGGSGYIGRVSNGTMSNGVRTGDGYARISW